MSLLNWINQYWLVIFFCGTIIASWVRYENKINNVQSSNDALKDRTEKLEKKVDGFDSFRESIQIDIGQIKTTLSFIREAIAKLIK